jgi:hypothetical protein
MDHTMSFYMYTNDDFLSEGMNTGEKPYKLSVYYAKVSQWTSKKEDIKTWGEM